MKVQELLFLKLCPEVLQVTCFDGKCTAQMEGQRVQSAAVREPALGCVEPLFTGSHSSAAGGVPYEASLAGRGWKHLRVKA